MRKTRKQKKIKAVTPKKDIEAEYRGYMQRIVREMAEEVKEGLIPLIKQNKTRYMGDGKAFDGWADDVTVWMDLFRAKWSSFLFRNKVRTDIQRPLSMAESATTSQFLKGINRAVGVDVSGMLSREGIDDYMQSALSENVSLVTNMPEDYIKRIDVAVQGGMRNGLAPTSIARDIQEATGITYRRASLIARDQMAKINSDITRKRSENLGIKYFKWSTSKDERVSGNPSGKYPKAKIKCYMISKADNGLGEGVYTYKDGAKYAGETKLFPGHAHVGCRCSSIPMIDGVNWNKP